jgi:hypothetical protein
MSKQSLTPQPEKKSHPIKAKSRSFLNRFSFRRHTRGADEIEKDKMMVANVAEQLESTQGPSKSDERRRSATNISSVILSATVDTSIRPLGIQPDMRLNEHMLNNHKQRSQSSSSSSTSSSPYNRIMEHVIKASPQMQDRPVRQQATVAPLIVPFATEYGKFVVPTHKHFFVLIRLILLFYFCICLLRSSFLRMLVVCVCVCAD